MFLFAHIQVVQGEQQGAPLSRGRVLRLGETLSDLAERRRSVLAAGLSRKCVKVWLCSPAYSSTLQPSGRESQTAAA